MSREVLDLLQAELGDLVGDYWAERTEQYGERVALYRDYMDGQHRANMTNEMKKMLRITSRADGRDEGFNANYCELVVESMTDRLKVTGVEAIAPDAQTELVAGEDAEAPDSNQTDPGKPLQDWADERLDHNRFDALQADVHDAVIRDGDSFVMISFNNETQRSEWSYEPAYDGDYGMLVVYDRMGRKVEAAIKIWWERGKQYINIYYPDRVKKLEAVRRDIEEDTAGSFEPVQTLMLEPRDVSNTMVGVRVTEGGDLLWTDPSSSDGLGVPVVPFHNKRIGRATHGKSEMEGAISLNDALNRNLASMVMTAELTAFSILLEKGLEIPAGLTPGMTVGITFQSLLEAGVAGEDLAGILGAIDVKRIQPGDIVPFIDQAKYLIEQIGTVSRTPLPGFMGGDNASGESLKQREAGLIGKIKKSHVRLGNSWEDVLTMAHKIESAFATQSPPDVLRFSCQWADAEVRNDSQFIKDVKEVADIVGQKETLMQLGTVFGWDEAKVTQIMDEKAAEKARVAGAVDRTVPDYSGLSIPVRQPDALAIGAAV
ncbi:phage portal protein [Phototrophicus methaneseepsis]|uniref:Phage portal protein n=1 Tax=Phototrophicus methaneseepsis TaxID=2710758 RepID=A0A7S8E698_9CHLR|nr:phage portal protein [Phototrophicus methaneseepsis]QPC81049.1 phage portal protein [Phototrophicus methaneseepsis]